MHDFASVFGVCAYFRNSFFFEIQNLSNLADLPNQLWWAGRPQFTYFGMIMYLHEWFLHKLVYFVDLNKY